MVETLVRAAAFSALAVFVVAPRSAWADTGPASPAEAFERFGLLGTWSPDCSAAVSTLNPRVTWKVVDGVVVHTVTFDGRTVSVRDTITSADILGDQDMQVMEVRGDGLIFSVIIRLMAGHCWALRSVGPGGQLFIDEGMEVATGKPSLVDEQCEAVTS